MLFMPVRSVETTHSLARSALPDAPVIVDEGPPPRRRLEVRARVRGLLRSAVQRQTKAPEARTTGAV